MVWKIRVVRLWELQVYCANANWFLQLAARSHTAVFGDFYYHHASMSLGDNYSLST